MRLQFESLTENREFIILNNIVFNANQIKNNIFKDFKPSKNNLNFCYKNLFLKKYFREINNQGIFNRIEWKFWLKKDVECELITSDKIRQLDKLQIKIILNFCTNHELLNQANDDSEYFDLKVLLDYSLQKSQIEKIPATPIIDYRKTIFFKNINEQNTAYSYPLSSQKICV